MFLYISYRNGKYFLYLEGLVDNQVLFKSVYEFKEPHDALPAD